MRFLLVLLALIGAMVSLSAPAAARNWDETVTELPSGAFLIGNPDARVKLVEYLSYTCPHCAAFAQESPKVLDVQMIRSGSTSLEVRNFIRDEMDLGAAMLAHCAGPTRFMALSNAIFAKQDDWLPQGIDFTQANQRRLAMYPKLARLKAYAAGGGLTALAQAQGMTPQQTDACFANTALLGKILAMTSSAPASVTGTPGFFVNGKFEPVYDWAHLQPLLRAAGAR